MCVLVTAEMVAYSHSKGLKFAVWTFDVVDNSLTWSIYYDMGVDAITTGNILYIL
jgi:glycerophosphoryl diester phosphodiesterase